MLPSKTGFVTCRLTSSVRRVWLLGVNSMRRSACWRLYSVLPSMVRTVLESLPSTMSTTLFSTSLTCVPPL